MFVDILHLFTYPSIKLGLFTPRDHLGQGYPPYLLTFHVICLYIKGLFTPRDGLAQGRPLSLFVYYVSSDLEVTETAAMFVYIA